MEDWLALRVGSGGFARLCTALLCATVAGAPLKAAPESLIERVAGAVATGQHVEPDSSRASLLPARELTYLGYDALLDHSPSDGAFSIWQFDAAASSAGASPVLTPPLASSMWTALYRRFAYLGFDLWLEYEPSSGAYNMYRCDHTRWRVGLPPLCSSLCDEPKGCGSEFDLSGDVRVLYLGHDVILSLHEPTGEYALLQVQRAPARLVSPPRTTHGHNETSGDGRYDGLRGRVPALAGHRVAYIGKQMLVAIDPSAADPKVYVLCGNASEVAARRSPLRAMLTVPPTTAAILSSGTRRRVTPVGVGGGRLLLMTPQAPAGFAYELLHCAATACDVCGRLADDAALPRTASSLMPTSGELKCASLGAGSVRSPRAIVPGADVSASSVQSSRAAALALGDSAASDVDGEGGQRGAALPLPLSELVPPVERGRAQLQWLLLDGGQPTAGLRGRALFEYDAASGAVRLLRLGLPTMTPGTAATPGPNPGGIGDGDGSVASAVPTEQAESPRCDALPLPPYLSSSWASASHRLSSLGHATILDVDPTSSAFRVWRCEQLLPLNDEAPLHGSTDGTAEAAGARLGSSSRLPCSAVDNGVWAPLTRYEQVVWLGESLGDSVLLFDRSSGAYEVWPIRTTSGRVMPRPGHTPLAAGVWSKLVGCTLLHADGSTLIAVRPTSGEYTVMLVDSTMLLSSQRSAAQPPPSMAYGELAHGSIHSARSLVVPPQPAAASISGSISTQSSSPCAFAYHTVVYVGDDLLLSIDAASGAYCVLRFAREQPPRPPLSHVGGGDLHDSKCDASSCSECSAISGCGWCSTSNQCMQGDARGACGGACREHWTYGYCAEWPCEHHHTCDDCLSNDVCGWCGALGVCMAGSDSQPLALYCPAAYRFQSCDARTSVNATVVAV